MRKQKVISAKAPAFSVPNILFTLAFAFAFSAGCGGGGDEPEPPSEQLIYTPCAMAARNADVDSMTKLPASQLAKQLIRHAAQIGGVSEPAGGCFLIRGYRNAYYDPSTDHIAYGPEWLAELNDRVGHQREAGDSVLFHEVGHMWAFKTGAMQRIGIGSVDREHRQELQADSFAGFVLRRLNGDARPVIATYETVFAGWSPTHPPGRIRAQTFVDAWAREQVAVLSAKPAASESEEVAAARASLRRLQDVRAELAERGYNPYDSSSDEAFLRLWGR